MPTLADLNQFDINGVAFSEEALAPELIAYGEPEAAELLMTESMDKLVLISQRALEFMVKDGMFADKAICTAAVKIFFGEGRELKRKRRVYKND